MLVYFDVWIVHTILKDHIQWLRLIIERCIHIWMYLNMNKCIFTTPIGILLGHIISKDRIKVDMEKRKAILDLKPQVNEMKIKILLGHKGYYKRFI